MPRIGDPGRKEHQKRQKIYRQNLRDNRVPEIGKVDRALAEALSIYFHGLSEKGNTAGIKKISVLETLACASLVSEGYEQNQSLRCIRRRVRRDDAKKLFDKIDSVSTFFEG